MARLLLSIIIFALIGFFTIPVIALAAPIESTSAIPEPPLIHLQVPLGDVTGFSKEVGGQNITAYLAIVYQWLIRAAVVLSTLMFVIAGFMWLTAGGESGQIKKAHEIIKNTLIGLILAFGSYAILWNTNPKLVEPLSLRLDEIKDVEIKMEWVSTEESDSVITPQEASQQDTAAASAAATAAPGTAPGAVGGGTNGVPLFKQRNYRAFSYGSCGTISSAGCGPTSTAMVMKFYGKNVTPVDVARLFEGANVRQCNGSCSPTACRCCANQWNAFTDSRTVGAQGLRGEFVSGKNAVLALLRQNKPIVASMGPSIFTSGGHFIVLTGIAPNGDILINDPAKNISQATQEQVFGPIKGAWYIHP